MAIFPRTSKNDKADQLPDWRKHAALNEHQSKLADRRSKEPALAATATHAAQALHDADTTLEHAEVLHLAGRAEASVVETAREKRDAAKTEAAKATAEHAECARELALLEGGLPLVTEAAKREVAAQIVAIYTDALKDFAAKLEAAVEANERLVRLHRQAREQFPTVFYEDGWPQALSMFLPDFPNLRRAYTADGAAYHTKYAEFQEACARYLAEAEQLAKPTAPFRPAQQDDPSPEWKAPTTPAPQVAPLVRLPGVPSLETVMRSLGMRP